MTTDTMTARCLAALLLGMAALLTGCAEMSKTDCEKADWRELGRRDAENGQSSTRFQQRAESCSKAGVANADRAEYMAGHAQGQMNYCTIARGRDEALAGRSPSAVCQVAAAATAYRRGYDDGLLRFCTPTGGFEFGRAGPAYRDTCPAQSASAFQVGYRLGSELHELNRRLERINSQQAEERKVLADPKTTPVGRDNANRHLGQLDADEAAVRRLIRQAEHGALSLGDPYVPAPR
jgi:hypothetical protein